MCVSLAALFFLLTIPSTTNYRSFLVNLMELFAAMRIVTLSHAEAADKSVIANIAAHILGGDHHQALIQHADRPDVGATPVPALLPAPVIPAAPAVAENPFAGSTAVAAALPIAPATSTPAVPVPPVPALPTASAAPALPAPAAPPSPAASGTPETDARGLPWDARIHSNPPSKIKDGTWRQKRGSDPAVVAAVEAELRQVMGLPAPVAPAPVAPPVPPVNSVFALGGVPAMAPPVPPAAPEVPAAPAPATPSTFAELMIWLAPFMPHKVNTDQVSAALVGLGIPSLNALIARPDQVPTAYSVLLPLTQ